MAADRTAGLVALSVAMTAATLIVPLVTYLSETDPQRWTAIAAGRCAVRGSNLFRYIATVVGADSVTICAEFFYSMTPDTTLFDDISLDGTQQNPEGGACRFGIGAVASVAMANPTVEDTHSAKSDLRRTAWGAVQRQFL